MAGFSAYVGMMGSGKSYSAVAYCILPALREGRPVYTNLALDMERCRKEFPGLVRQFDIDEVVEDPERVNEWEGGALVVIDEAWKMFPKGVHEDKVPFEFRSLVMEHRHRVGDNGKSMELVLVVPNLSRCGKWIRDCVDTTYHHKKLDKVGAPGTFEIEVYDGGVEGQNPPPARLLDTRIGRYSPKVWTWYHSHTQSVSSAPGDESKTDKRGLIWLSWRMMGVYAVFVIAAGLVYLFGKPLYDKYYAPEPTVSADLGTKAPPSRPAFVSAPSREGLDRLERPVTPAAPGGAGWRVAGWYEHRQSGRRVIVTRGTEMRDVPANDCEWIAERVTRCDVADLGAVFAHGGQ